MINFIDIELIGFASFKGPFIYKLNRKGLNVIAGENGSGKTAIVSSIPFALFGEMIKHKASVTTWEHLRTKEYKGTKVTLRYKKGKDTYKIIRCKDYKNKIEGIKGASKVFLYINDKYQDHLRDVRDVNEEIIKSLGMSFKLFKNAILFGQKVTRLLSERGDKQKQIFDEAFATEFINKSRERARKKLDILSDSLDDLYEKKDRIKENLQREKESYSEILTLKKNFKKDKAQDLEDIESKITKNRSLQESIENDISMAKEYEKQLKGLQKVIKKHEEARKEYSNEEKILFQISLHYDGQEEEVKSLKDKIKAKKYESMKKVPKCPECGQSLDKQSRKEFKDKAMKDYKALKKELEKAESELDRLKNLKKEYASSEEKIKKLDKESHYHKNKTREIELRIRHLKGMDDLKEKREELKELENQRKKIKKRKFEYDLELQKERILKAKKSLKKLTKEIKSLKRKVDDHEWVIKDALSNKGLKAYIFNNMMKSINKRLRYYERFLNFRVVFSIDLDSGNKSFNALIIKEGNEIKYEDLSGGQQQLVDVALAFSINEINQEINPMNILFLDEVFESLSAKNIQIVSDIIHRKSENLAIHLITHQSEFVSARTVNSLKLTLRSGYTGIV